MKSRREAYVLEVRKACYDVMSETTLSGVTRRTVTRQMKEKKLKPGSNRERDTIMEQFKAEMLALESKLPHRVQYQLETLAAGAVPDDVRDALIELAEEIWKLALAAARVYPVASHSGVKSRHAPTPHEALEQPVPRTRRQPQGEFLPALKAFVENMLRVDLPASVRITRPISPAEIFRRLPLRLQSRGHSVIATDLSQIESELIYKTSGGGWWRRDRDISDGLANARPERQAPTKSVSRSEARKANDRRTGAVVEYLRRLRRSASRKEIYAALNLENHEVEVYRKLLHNRSRVASSLIREDENGRYCYAPYASKEDKSLMS